MRYARPADVAIEHAKQDIVQLPQQRLVATIGLVLGAAARPKWPEEREGQDLGSALIAPSAVLWAAAPEQEPAIPQVDLHFAPDHPQQAIVPGADVR